MRKFTFVLALAILGSSAIVLHAATELARVNNTVISLETFNQKYDESLKFFRNKVPTRQSVLDEMIKRELGIQEAKRMGLEKDPEVIERVNTVLYHSLIDKQLSKKFDAIDITNKEIEQYYKVNPEVRTSHIFVGVRYDANESQDKAALEKIKKIKQTLDEALKKGDKTFAEIANAHSEGVAAATGGDIDYQTKDKLDPAYYDTAIKLKVGGVSGIVRSQFGYHIIKLTGIKDFKDVDPGQYKRMIYDEKRNQIFEAYMGELKKKSKVSVNYDLIKQGDKTATSR